LKIGHFFSKSFLEDLLRIKFFQRRFPKKFQKFAYFLWKRSLPKIFLRSFENLAPGELSQWQFTAIINIVMAFGYYCYYYCCWVVCVTAGTVGRACIYQQVEPWLQTLDVITRLRCFMLLMLYLVNIPSFLLWYVYETTCCPVLLPLGSVVLSRAGND